MKPNFDQNWTTTNGGVPLNDSEVPFSQKQQSSNTSVITSIIQRQMEALVSLMKPSVSIGRSQQSMLISQIKIRSMPC